MLPILPDSLPTGASTGPGQRASSSGTTPPASQQAWEVAFRHSPLPSLISDARTGVCLYCNDEMERFLQLASPQVLGRTAVQLRLWSRSTEERLITRRLHRHGSLRNLELRLPAARGRDRYVLVSMEAVQFNARACHLVQLVDITTQKKLEQDLRLTAAAVEHSGDALVILNARGTIVSVNPAFTRITGHAARKAVGRSFDRLLLQPTGRYDPGYFRSITGTLRVQGHWEGEVWARCRGGEAPLLLSLSAILDQAARITHYVCVFTDISRQKENEERLKSLALYDELTGLANRTLFTERGERALVQAARRATTLAVMFIDLDLFKQVNDAHGHAVGDALLVQVAQRLGACVRAADTVARFGGDEFIILTLDAGGPPRLANVAQRVLAQLHKPFRVDGLTLLIGASIGIACYPQNGQTLDALLEAADTSLYEVKSGGRGGYLFADTAGEDRSRC